MSTLIPVPFWARTTSVIQTPNSDMQNNGWSVQEVPPAEFVNWLHRYAGEWIENLSDNVATYDTLDSFVASAEVGDRGIVRGYAGNRQPSELLADENYGQTISIDGDGRYVYLVDNAGNVLRTTRELTGSDSGGADFNYTIPSGTALRAVSNGVNVAIAHGNSVSIYDVDNATALGTFDHGGIVQDVAIDGERVYLVGAGGTGGFEARAIEIDSPTSALWSFEHGATLSTVVTDGVRVYLGGNSGGGGAGTATVRALNLDGVEQWFDDVGTVAGNQRMCTDGERLFVQISTATLSLSTLLGNTLETYSSGAHSAGDEIHCTPRYLFRSTGSGASSGVIYIDRQSPGLGGTFNAEAAAAPSPGATIFAVYCDGDRLYIGGAVAGGAGVRAYRLPQLRDQTFVRTDTTIAFQPLRGLAFPQD